MLNNKYLKVLISVIALIIGYYMIKLAVNNILIVLMLGLIGFSTMIYMLPSIIAYKRNHLNIACVVLVNIFFGWTLLGWLIALIWATSSHTTYTHKI